MPEERPENGKEDGHVHTGGRWFQAAGTASAKSQWAFTSELKDSAAGWMRMGRGGKGEDGSFRSFESHCKNTDSE